MKKLVPLTMLAVLALSACDRLSKAEPEKQTKKPAATSKATTKAKAKSKTKAEAAPEHGSEPRRYVVPFAWEASQREPLAQARSFLKEILTDNEVYMEHGPRFFAAFADGQKPRATVVTCSDSRVHTPAFDTTPENDDFMIRNIGNQIVNSHGSVEYGVEHLETPVLMILGHTGCGAVKAALGDISGQAEPVRKELEGLNVPKPKQGVSPEAAWSAAVIANVHNQVSFALQHFGERVQEGKLTVVGAVYDFRNDLGNGAGKLTVVDVNGNAEPERMQAFIEAVEAEGSAAHGKKKDSKGGRDSREAGPHRSVDSPRGPRASGSTFAKDEDVVDALGKIPGLQVHRPEPRTPEPQAAVAPHAAVEAHAAKAH